MAGTIVTVSQLCRYVKSLLEEQKPLADLLVRGEVSGLSFRSATGHLYFTLVDGDSAMRCVMFSRYAQKLAHFPEDGGMVVARGNVSLYERDGSFQLIVYDLQELATAGAGKQTLEEVKKRLVAEGLFSAARKRPLPSFPRAVAVVTSPEGAALQDILATFAQHNPLVKLIVYPATVQGAGAVASVCAALCAVAREGLCQSCVIARGGGSSEDLSAFNDEALVRAVAACPVPVVSAVGHEVDFSLTDLVADARAATPTAACRLLCAPAAQLEQAVREQQIRLRRTMLGAIGHKRLRLERLTMQLTARSPAAELKKNRQTTNYLIKSLQEKQLLFLERLRSRTENAMNRLELVNPMHLLRQGYSITTHDGAVVTSPQGLRPGDRLITRLAEGTVASVVERTG